MIYGGEVLKIRKQFSDLLCNISSGFEFFGVVIVDHSYRGLVKVTAAKEKELRYSNERTAQVCNYGARAANMHYYSAVGREHARRNSPHGSEG